MKPNKAWFVVAVAALGYFVNIFDIALFSITRVPSLMDLGLTGDELMSQGMILLNIQMFGMLVGGLLWGLYGDRSGRIAVLFGSIFTYSLANLLNAYVQSVPQYAVLRFVAGVGLAGELGAGITLATETLSKERRGIGTTIIATVGVFGALSASYVTDLYSWRVAYIVGGVLGFLLLLTRFGALESGMYTKIKSSSAVRGSLRYAFATKARIVRCLHCISVGLPIYFVAAVLVAFAPEVSAALGFKEVLSAGEAVFCSYAGFFIGDISSGVTSQLLKSRIKTLVIFTVATFVMAMVVLLSTGLDKATAKILYIVLGSFAGYWAIFVTVAAEQFGTNLRSTMATSIPNFVRASTIPITGALTLMKPHLGLKYSAMVVLLVCTGLALYSMSQLDETFARDLDYVE
jgi:MFS transporter, putative metabolite:H+ symporter